MVQQRTFDERPPILSYRFNRRTPFNHTLTLEVPTGTPFDLTGYTVHIKITGSADFTTITADSTPTSSDSKTAISIVSPATSGVVRIAFPNDALPNVNANYNVDVWAEQSSSDTRIYSQLKFIVEPHL